MLGFLHAVGSYWTIALAAWIALDVAGRTFFNHPLQGTVEVVGYSLPFATFLQIPYVLRAKAHLRSPLIEDYCGIRGRAILATLACLLGVTLFSLGAYSVWPAMMTAWRAGESIGDGVVAIPAGPLWTAIFSGCILMLVQFLFDLANSLKRLVNPAREPLR